MRPMVRLPLIDHRQHERALRMAAAATQAGGLGLPASAPAVRPGLMRDRYGRRITYVRLSVTDRCNLKCTYCTPVSSGVFLPPSELLTDDEIVSVLETMARFGLEKVRFTGGEPLVRPGFVDLVRRVAAIPGIFLRSLSTNGILLEEMAADLLAAGITGVNVSVDTLDPERFREVTRGGSLDRVWRGVERVLALGLRSVKLNAVLMRGVNDGDAELEAFARLTYRYPVSVRFIELMPLSHCGDVFHEERYVPADRVLAALARLGPATEMPRDANDGPALCWRLPGALGTVGVISPVSESSFCARCNRVRLSAGGQLKLCLFGDEHVDLKRVLRGGGSLEAALLEAMDRKPEKMAGYSGFTMMSIGG